MGRLITLALLVMGIVGLGLVAWVSLEGGKSASAPAAVAEAPPSPDRMVLTTSTPLRVGALIKPEDIAEKNLPVRQVPEGAFDDTPGNRRALVGAMVRHALGAGEALTGDDVMRPGDHGFLAAVLQPGMRAVTLGADSLVSTIDLVWPGDHVDVILTQQADGAVSAGRRVFGNTVLTYVRVLAVDQQLAQGATPDAGAKGGAHSVTLEVTPEEATRLSVASRLGKLALAVVAADTRAGGPQPPPVTTWAGDVVPGLGTDKPPRRPATVRVWQGGGDGKEFQF